MSAETEEWLNQNILIGFTAKRGNAWHYRASAQGAESNHYEGAIPTEDVVRRLFDWDFLIGDISSTVVHADGVTVVSSTDRQAIIRPAGVLGGEHAEPEILGIFKTACIRTKRRWSRTCPPSSMTRTSRLVPPVCSAVAGSGSFRSSFRTPSRRLRACLSVRT
jgi:hypothetical protein